MTKDNQNKLMRLVIMIANRPEVLRKMLTKIEFAEAAILVYPLIHTLGREGLALLRQELLEEGGEV